MWELFFKFNNKDTRHNEVFLSTGNLVEGYFSVITVDFKHLVSFSGCTYKRLWIIKIICGAARILVPHVRFKKRELY